MNFLINELSFIGQAKNIYDADTLMKALAEVIKAISPTQGNDYIYVDELFSNCKIAENYTVKNWVYDKSFSNEQAQAVLLIQLFTNGPFILDVLEQELEYWECEFNGQDYWDSSLAGAAYLQGILISLQEAPDFSSELINVTFKLDENTPEIIEIYNLTNADQVKNIPERYLPKKLEIYDGVDLWQRKDKLFPHLKFCDHVEQQIKTLLVSDPMFKQVKKKLFELEESSKNWKAGSFNYDTLASKASPESKSRLEKFDKELTFRCPDQTEKTFTLHVRMTPSAWRLYFFPSKPGQIIIGYIGRKIQ
ncbi:MAG TPA: hypothetical protein V6D21_14575 [Candidatus Obscuribacterales bacterium]